ncbi:type VI secretion system contractile sheath large subunit [Pantoea sp. M_5]|uniref:type VI secretion system contractile sheath large subunit n=2 Tax=Enterobacterales TaxID=91347 RepID=UPI001231A7B4|nr:type VI secretion system contractile sheath large subunit [Pantoea sp. M_5]
MLMSVKNENAAGGESVVLERPAAGGVYASLFEKINLNPVSELSALDIWQDAQAMSDATADERLTAGMQVFLECLTKSGSKVEKLDKNLIDHHIAELDYQISRQLDAVMHSEEFQAVESLWRGVKSLVDKTDFRQNVKVELLDMSKEELRQDFEDSPEIIQSGLYKQTYIEEYDTPGGEPIAALISAYEFDASAQDVALLRNISKVSAAAHMPFIGSAGPKFFLKDSMEEVAAIKDIGNYFDRAEYIKWKSFRETDDSRYIGLVMPRVLGRLPYGPDTVPVRSFNYVEEVKGPDHDKYLWTNASFAFAANMVRSFINNGWCVQIRGPQAGGAVVMPRVLGRLPYGPDTVPVRSFNYVEEVKGPDHDKYLWTNASFAFAANMVRSFINNGWCVQIRGPQAGGAVQDLPIHLYDLGTGNQVKIPSEVMIPETREFEFANLGFIPLSYYKNRDYACFFSANSTQKPALYDTADATANSRINARLPYIFLLSRIAHYLKLIQRENIGTTKDRRLLELELNTWVRSLVTEMTDPGDELQASHPLRDARVVVEDIEDNPGFFRVKLYAVPHFQVEGMDVSYAEIKQNAAE